MTRRVVLVVGMDHDDDVGAARERRRGSRSSGCRRSPRLRGWTTMWMPEAARDLDGAVARGVVDEDDVVDAILRDVGVGPLEGLLGVVRGHDDARPGDSAAAPQTPRRVRMTGSVRRRIDRSSPKDQLFKYARSYRSLISGSVEYSPETCARPVSPGRAACRSAAARDRLRVNARANSGRSGRGPTRLMSPRSTFQSCGISSIARGAQRAPDRASSAGSSGQREHRARLDLGALAHRSQLPELEGPAVPADRVCR